MPMPRKANQKVQRDTEQSLGSEPKAVRRDKSKKGTGSWPARCEEEGSQQSAAAQSLEDDPDILIGLNLEDLSELQAPIADPVDSLEHASVAEDLVESSELPVTTAFEHELESYELPAAMVSEQEVESWSPVELTQEDIEENSLDSGSSEGIRENPTLLTSSVQSGPYQDKKSEGIRENPTLLTSSVRVGPYEDDLKVAESIAKARGLPPDMESEAVTEFLLQYGYNAYDHQCWVSASAEHQPQLTINVSSHIEFGNHTQYEFECRVQARQGTGIEEIVWRTIRRLKHLRGGLHDPVKQALGLEYNHYFGHTPFAHHTAPAGTTARLKAWFSSLATCISLGSLKPAVVAHIFRVLDGPGTPLHTQGKCSRSFSTAKDFEQIPVTAAMFGSKHLTFHQGQGPSHCHIQSQFTFCRGSEYAATLEVAFDIEGLEKKVQILQRPLGAVFSKRSSGPLTIRKVQPESHAEQLGLQVGWAVKSLGGMDVSNMTFEQTQDAMKSGLMRLPFHLDP